MQSAFSLRTRAPLSPRTAIGALAVVAAAVAGAAVSVDPAAAVLVLLLMIVGLLLLRFPLLAVFLIGALMLFAEWFTVADQTGFMSVPKYVTSVSFLPVILLLVALYVRPPLRLEPAVAGAALAYACGVLMAVLVGAFKTASFGPLWEGGKALSVMALPILLMWNLAAAKRAVIPWLLFGVFAIEAGFATIQAGLLTYNASQSSIFTVGETRRWWDWAAVYGTFPATGNHHFGDALVFFACVFLIFAFATRTPRLQRWMFAVGVAACIVLVLMSEARSAAFSLAAVTLFALVVYPSWRRLGAIVLAAVLAGVVGLAVAGDRLDSVFERGIWDRNSQGRVEIWQGLLRSPNVDWIWGEGFGLTGAATAEAGLLGYGNRGAGEKTQAATENLFIRAWLEGGLVWLGLLLVSLGLLTRAALRRIPEREWGLALAGCVIALCVQSLTIDSIYFNQSLAVFWFVVGSLGAGIASSLASAGSAEAELPARA
jgi:hypothetical protein